MTAAKADHEVGHSWAGMLSLQEFDSLHVQLVDN
jgi:hypothetical protein